MIEVRKHRKVIIVSEDSKDDFEKNENTIIIKATNYNLDNYIKIARRMRPNEIIIKMEGFYKN